MFMRVFYEEIRMNFARKKKSQRTFIKKSNIWIGIFLNPLKNKWENYIIQQHGVSKNKGRRKEIYYQIFACKVFPNNEKRKSNDNQDDLEESIL